MESELNDSIEYRYDPTDFLVIESLTGSEGGKKFKTKQKSYREKVESEWSHESTMKDIEEVELRRSLWDAGCAEYKLPKKLLWQEVADTLQASINNCKGKWANLRTSFNCNLEKYRRKKSGQGTDENFQIVWKYFKPMLFLEATKVRQTAQSISSMQLESGTTDDSIMFEISEDLSSSGAGTTGQQRQRKSATQTSTSSNKSQLQYMDIEAFQSLKRADSQPKDTATFLGEYIAAELRNLTPELAEFARGKLRRALNDTLDEVALMQQQ